jgi:hypothetical protein
MIAALFDEKRRISRKHQKHRQHNWSLLKVPSNPKLGGKNVAINVYGGLGGFEPRPEWRYHPRIPFFLTKF